MHRAAATFACDDGIGCWYSTREEGRGTTDTLRTWLRWTFQPPSPTSLIHSSHSDMQARPTPIGQDTWARATAAPCIESQSTSMKTCLEGGEAGEGGGGKAMSCRGARRGGGDREAREAQEGAASEMRTKRDSMLRLEEGLFFLSLLLRRLQGALAHRKQDGRPPSSGTKCAAPAGVRACELGVVRILSCFEAGQSKNRPDEGAARNAVHSHQCPLCCSLAYACILLVVS